MGWKAPARCGGPIARPRRLGARPGVDLDKALALSGQLEDEEILRKLALHGAELCSSDNDLSRFEGLRWTNPL